MTSDRKIGQIEDRRQEMLVKESSEISIYWPCRSIWTPN